MKKLVMTGGGTGGHIIPNMALIPELKKHFKIYYLGEENSLEENLISKFADVTFIKIPAVKFIRKLTLKNVLIPFKLLSYINKTKKILKELKPDVVFAKGGYVSLPVVFAASKLKIPILAHESDYSVGLANKLIMRKAKILFTSFRDTCIGNKCLYSGSPIRKEVFSGNKEIAKKYCNFINEKTTLMFFGGSKGSRKINSFVTENIDKLSDFNIIHFIGKGNSNNIKRTNYFQIEFTENIYDFFALSDIVVCRAGANSIFELLAIRKPMILIPLPAKESRGDQIENAKVFRNEGYADVLEEVDLNIENFLQKIENVSRNKFYYINNMKKYRANMANEIICKYIIEYSEQK